jgi:aquaporin Z
MTFPSTASSTGSVPVQPSERSSDRPDHGYGLATRLGVEALGSFLLIFAGLGIALFNGAGNQTSVPVGFGFGLALMAALIAFGHISGGHFNPVISVAAALAGRIKWLDTLWYVLAHVVGGLLAGLVLFLLLNIFPAVTSGTGSVTAQTLFSSLSNGFAEHSPSQIPLAGALLIEVVASAVFAAVFLGATQSRANRTLSPVGIGLAYAVLITVALPLTNASLNPARSLATVFFAESWAPGQLWLFVVAPLLGAALAGLVYRAFAAPEHKVPSQAAEDGSELDREGELNREGELDREGELGREGRVGNKLPDAGKSNAPAGQQRPGRTDAQDFFDNPSSGS